MSKGLKALRKLQRGQYGTREQFNEQLSIIEKELKMYERLKEDIIKCSCWKEHKVLEIIKEKRVDIGWLIRSKNCSKYNLGVGESQALKKEEYDLLKEVLL